MSVDFQAVRFAYPGHAPVLAQFDLSVGQGEVVTVVGRSGAGKTTVLKLVNRLLLPSGGRVHVQGRDTRDWDPIQLRRRTGYVFQEIGLFPHMSVGDNVGIVPRIEGWPDSRLHARTSELLGLVGLDASQFAGRYPHELSGGQRQRVGLARALAADPAVLLMDEPFGALDPITRAEVRREFTRIQRQLSITTILVTHDAAEAFVLGDRVAVLDAGRMIAIGGPDEVASSREPAVRTLLAALPRWN